MSPAPEGRTRQGHQDLTETSGRQAKENRVKKQSVTPENIVLAVVAAAWLLCMVLNVNPVDLLVLILK